MHFLWQVGSKTFMVSGTPFEAMYKKKPNLKSIKVFGCSAFVHVEKNL